MQQPSPSAETETLLARLSQRPGVQSTLILSRDTGAIVRSSGLVTADEEIEVASVAPAHTNGTAADESDVKAKTKGTRKEQEVARIVWQFVKGAGAMVEELNGENDEAKLIRVRTKKNELVIVPDAKFLAVVVHDMPAA